MIKLDELSKPAGFLIACGFASFLLSLGLFISLTSSNPYNSFKLSSLPNGTGYQFCTSEVGAKGLICNEKSIGMEIDDNTSASNLNNFIKDCPSAVIVDSKNCIGKRIFFIDGKFQEQQQ